MNKRIFFEQRLVNILKIQLDYTNKKELWIRDAYNELLEVKNDYDLTENNLDEYIEESIECLKTYIFRLNKLIREADALRESIEEIKEYVSVSYDAINFFEPNCD